MSRRFRICMAKGGRGSARPTYGRPKLTLISREKKIASRRCYKNLAGRNLDSRAKSSLEDFFNVHKKFSQEDLALKSKLRPAKFL